MSRWVLLTALLAPAGVSAAEPPAPRFNLKWSTVGGMQFWSDELLFHQWRIQQNTFSGHCRLLDGNNVRHAWGTYDQCRQELDRIRAEFDLPPMRKHAVLVVHGLYGTRGNCRQMVRFLEVYGGYQVFDVAYPSTQSDLAEHGAWFERLLLRLEGVETVDIVAHSLGTLVVRAYVARSQADDFPAAVPVPKIKRMVMVGPPSQGATLAREYGRNRVWEWIGGKAGHQLGDWEQAQKDVAVPDFPFGIIAGSLAKDNPLIEGPDDGLVTVADTRIPGARDFLTFDDNHLHLMDNVHIQRAALRFLQQGHFRSAAERAPIE